MGFSLLERATGVIRSLRESHATLEQGNGETLIAQREERIKTAADQIATFHQLPYGAFEETAKNVFKKPDPSIPLIRLVRLNEQRFLVELELTERTDALRLGHSQAGKYWL
ncbi:MAG TPA: hypothetical protein VJC10_01190, partial [Patescibacteria group bacterium]|nr:hypothetical protein [Patescibacteria group bacterium]